MPAFTVQLGLPVWLDYLVSFILAMLAVSLLAAALYFIGFERYLRDLIGSFILSLGLLLLLEGVYLVGIHRRASRGAKVLPGQVSLAGGAMETQRLASAACRWRSPSLCICSFSTASLGRPCARSPRTVRLRCCRVSATAARRSTAS